MMNLLTDVDFVQPTRNFSLAYIILDSLFIVGFVTLLFLNKKRITALWSLAGGILYFIVDFGIFYAVLNSRAIYSYAFSSPDNTALLDATGTGLVLLWMSLSYGITNFAFIWLWLSKDKHALEYTALIVVFWICCPLISSFINNLAPDIICFQTTRGTDKYHGVMGLIMLVGYFIVIIMNILNKKGERIPIVRLFVIGFLVQFLWEASLLVFGIRSQNYGGDFYRQIMTLLQDSLVETNLGLPYIYFIHKAVTDRYNDDLTSKNLSRN